MCAVTVEHLLPPPACPLCVHDALEPYFIAETANFLLLAAGEPLTDGHLLLAPRAHVPCMVALPPTLDPELQRLKSRAVGLLEQIGTPAGVFEQADLEEERAHAYWHLVPSVSDLLPELRRGRKDVRIDTLEQLRAAAGQWRRYLYWEQGGTSVALDDAGAHGPPLVERVRQAHTTRQPTRQGRAAAQWLRGLWQQRLAAAGEPIQVVTCLLRRGERLCLLRRSPLLDSAPGKWHAVSGYLPEGVEPIDQAYREVEQEVGLSRSQVDLARVVPPLIFGSPALGRMWRIYAFLFDLLESEPTLNWEHTDLAWVHPWEVERYDCVGSLPELVRRLVLNDE